MPFRVLDEVIDSALDVYKEILPNGPFDSFQLGVFDRSFNSIKAIKCLVENGHWEGAAGIARQLMELALSMERIFVCSEEPEGAAIRFIRYGLLQEARYIRALAEYHEKLDDTYPPVPMEVRDQALAIEFPEFKIKEKEDGSVRWASSWCGKDTYSLARESPNPVRLEQYELLYRSWSEQVHGAPGALMTAVFPGVGNSERLTQLIYQNDKRLVETVANSINIFCELWLVLPLTRSTFSKEKADVWMKQLIASQIGGWSKLDE